MPLLLQGRSRCPYQLGLIEKFINRGPVKALRETEVSLRRALRKASKNGDLASATIAADPSKGRQAVNEALCALEQQRHEARRVVFALALEEGMSIGELGRLWGFSRQLAQRYAKEARCGQPRKSLGT